mmetsp:Transcript_19073/g.50152  ORF Transcript_19073/g.50152 Transcript_19073/m.50152 type:complete len:207 (-) Transcript_19073:4417-5037(-)
MHRNVGAVDRERGWLVDVDILDNGGLAQQPPPPRRSAAVGRCCPHQRDGERQGQHDRVVRVQTADVEVADGEARHESTVLQRAALGLVRILSPACAQHRRCILLGQTLAIERPRRQHKGGLVATIRRLFGAHHGRHAQHRARQEEGRDHQVGHAEVGRGDVHGVLTRDHVARDGDVQLLNRGFDGRQCGHHLARRARGAPGRRGVG